MAYIPDHNAEFHTFFAGDSEHLIIAITMHDDLVIQDEEENNVFLHPSYRGINEKLNVSDMEEPLSRLIDPRERIDQMAIFVRLINMQWKDRHHEFIIMGSFIESVIKIFEFKMELCIHDLIVKKKEICLIQAGFVEEREERNSPLFTIFQCNDFKNEAFSNSLKYFFWSRGLEYEWLCKMPEEIRINDFLEEEREAARIYGIYLCVNRSKFLRDFDKREDGLWVLKKIMEEFYSELDNLFENKNAFTEKIKNVLYKQRLLIYKERLLNKKKRKPRFSKDDGDQFFISCDLRGIELLDFVHLKIWNYPNVFNEVFIIEKHFPALKFNYKTSNKKEFEFQKERLHDVL